MDLINYEYENFEELDEYVWVCRECGCIHDEILGHFYIPEKPDKCINCGSSLFNKKDALF